MTFASTVIHPKNVTGTSSNLIQVVIKNYLVFNSSKCRIRQTEISFNSTVFYGQKHKAQPLQSTKPARSPHTWQPNQSTIIPRPHQLFTTLYPWLSKQDKLAPWTTHWMGVKPLHRFPSHKETLPIKLYQNIQHIHFLTDRLNIIQGAAVECDPIYNTLYPLTLHGWPEHIHQVPWIVQHFWGTRDQLSIEDSSLVKGNIVCLPQELHDRILADLCNSHQDTEKIRLTTWGTVYWPRIDTDIIDYVKRCWICTYHKTTQAVQLMPSLDIPNGPWKDHTATFLTYQGKDYLLVYDTFGKYQFIYRASPKTTHSVQLKIQQLISQDRPPEYLFIDNRLPFLSEDCTKFMINQHIKYLTSSHLSSSSIASLREKIIPLETLLLNLWSTPIGPYMPLLRQILHNWTQDHLQKPFTASWFWSNMKLPGKYSKKPWKITQSLTPTRATPRPIGTLPIP